MRRNEEYAINHTIYTSKKIAEELHCSVTTVYNHWSMTRGTDQEKFDSLKHKLSQKTFKAGFTSLQSVSQKTHYDRSMIYNFIRSVKGKKYHTELLKAGEHLQPQIMIQTVDLADFIADLQEYKKESDRWMQFKKDKQLNDEKKEREHKKSLAELKKEHPLVKDERFFKLSFFPNIDSYTILTECNYKRPKDEK